MGGRIEEGKKNILLVRRFAWSQLQVRESELKKHFVKINSGLNRKLPAAGCFDKYDETPGASAGGEQ